MPFFQFIDPITTMTGLYGEAESVEVSTTNDSNFQQKLRLSALGLALGSYRIAWSYSWNVDSTSSPFIARIQVNDSVTVYDHVEEPTHASGDYEHTGSDQQLHNSGVVKQPLSGDVTIDLDWKAPDPKVPASIWSARLELWRIS